MPYTKTGDIFYSVVVGRQLSRAPCQRVILDMAPLKATEYR